MKLMQFGDLHLDPATAENTRPAAAEILAASTRERPDLILNCGDLSMRRGHLVPWVALELRELHVALAEIAPTIVVAGNHDLATAGSEVGTVLGALARAEADISRLRLFERPGLVYAHGPVLLDSAGLPGGLWVACLPYPSRHWLLAQRPDLKADELLPELSRLLLETLHGLAAQIPAGERAILVYHGSIAGARTDSEQTMTTELDLVLHEHEIPACFEAVLCGHIHRHQQIGRAVYCGSPAPLTFAEERGVHGCVVWRTVADRQHPNLGEELSMGQGWAMRHVPLPVAHPLITVDLRGEGAREAQIAGPLGGQDEFGGARVRVLLTLRPGESAETTRLVWTVFYSEMGAAEVRVMIERPEEVRISGPEVKAEASIESLLNIYCERHPEAAEIKEELVVLALGLETRLPADARIQAAAAGYKLLRLDWSNWKSYGEGNSLVLEDLGKLVAIEGENASGKSNAAELEAFALYGRFIRGRQSLAEAVRIGADQALISATFEASHELWKVERRIKVNSRGVGSMDLAFFQWERYSVDDPETWLPRSLGSSRETQAYIEQLVGPFDLYVQTRFASQGAIDAMLDLTPAELTELLQQALATSVFEAREALARPALVEAERAAEKHEAGIAHWREIAGEREARKGELERCEVLRSEARDELAGAEDERKRADTLAQARRREAEEVGERTKRWEESLGRQQVAAARVGALESSIVAAESFIREAEQATAARAELPGLVEQRQGAKGQAEIRRARATLLEGERRTLSRLQRTEERDTLRRQAGGRHASEAVDRAKVAVREAERRSGLIARVPFGEKCIEAACPFVKDAGEARAGLPKLTAEVRDAEAVVGLETSANSAEETEALERIKAHREAVDEAETRLAELVVDEPAIRRMEARLAELEALEPRVIAGHEARAAKALRQDELAPARAECARLTAAHEALGERPCAEQARAALQEAARAVNSCEVERSARLVQEAVEALASARARLELSLEAEQKLAAAEEQSARLERARRVASVYLSACGRDGLPFLMLERALPALEGHANHFLCDDAGSGLRLEIEGLRELQSGGQRSEVVIRYRNDFGVHSLAAASGFERTAIGYALRAALAQLQAEAQGMTVSHWIADEGWGVFDEINIVRVGQPMLRRLAERFGRVIVISHQAPIAAICDTRLRVEGDPARGSRLVAA